MMYASCFLATALAVAAQAAYNDKKPPAHPPGYVNEEYRDGPGDKLRIEVYKDPQLSQAVQVRPDGKITLPLINDLHAAGLTPEQLRQRVQTESARFIEDPTPSVVVKQINSRKVFITGEVAKPGPYPLMSATTVLQLLSMAGGLNEYAAKERIVIVRVENGQPVRRLFNYKWVLEGKNLYQNIELKPGDTVIVP